MNQGDSQYHRSRAIYDLSAAVTWLLEYVSQKNGGEEQRAYEFACEVLKRSGYEVSTRGHGYGVVVD